MADEVTPAQPVEAVAATKALTPEEREDRRMHLDHMQGIIGRLSQLGFTMRGWAVTFVGGVFTLNQERASWRVLALSLVGLLFFWFLDARLLALEHAYRERYDAAASSGWNRTLTLKLKDSERGWKAIFTAGRRGFTVSFYVLAILATVGGWLALAKVSLSSN